MEVEIKGSVEPGFELVQDEFTRLWNEIEVGASFCVFHQGRKIIDLWGGFTDRDEADEWQGDTLVNVYSATKGPASLAMAILYDEGLIDYEEKVSTYWPEFGAEGKQNITVAQLLSHQAGLSSVESRLTVEDLYDWDKMVNLLAAQKPLWEPGSAAGYHAITWGYFPGELIRRVTGKTLGEYFHEKVALPLNADFYIGLPESEFYRCATLIGPNHARMQSAPAPAVEMSEFHAGSLLNPTIYPFKHACSTPWRKAEIAASNGHTSARGLATIYGALAMKGELRGVSIISPESLEQAIKVEVEGTEDLVLGGKLRRARGFMLNSDGAYGLNDESFGHAGTGGSLGFADPVAGIGFGYVMNQIQSGATAIPRSKRLLNAVLQCLSDKPLAPPLKQT
jgi:CubicO group peptidase (beta-lactamase class C family)